MVGTDTGVEVIEIVSLVVSGSVSVETAVA